MKILWGSPLPPVRSGVSDYAAELLPELAARAEVRILRPPLWHPPAGWPIDDLFELVPSDARAEDDEISVIHLGNNPHHLWLVDRLEGPRTVVVLHDLVLHHLLVEAEAAKGAAGELETRLRGAHGEQGARLAAARNEGMTGRRDPFLYPAFSAFLGAAAAAVVHSRWAKQEIKKTMPGLWCRHMGLAVADPGRPDRGDARRRLGIDEHDLVLMHLGFLTPEKGLESILAAVAAAARLGVPVRLLLVGEGRGLAEVRAAAERCGIGDRVQATGWLDPADLASAPAAADLGVVLRTPSAGETSAAAVRFLACGTPVAVGASHQFLEWPEAAAPRITPGPAAASELSRWLVEAAAGGEGWAERRAAARAAYEVRHRPDRCAGQLIELLESVAQPLIY